MEIYEGLEENLERFKNDLTDEKTRLLFSIAYKQGYDKALNIHRVSRPWPLTEALIKYIKLLEEELVEELRNEK